MSTKLTEILDNLRILMQDSKCPMHKRCAGYCKDQPQCTDTQGRTEKGVRTDCYLLAKQRRNQTTSEHAGFLYQLWGMD